MDPACQMIVIIPCFAEPDLISTLQSLASCEPPGYKVEVIIVLNHGELARENQKEQNYLTLSQYRQWLENNPCDFLDFHLIKAFDLPSKTAGVGLARKIGMDEALRRFVSIHTNGTMVCLDADCRVSPNYLQAIDRSLVQKRQVGVGEMHFEHLYEEAKEESLKTGMINYELFLRYYVEGLRRAQFPHAIHTIGSCMLCKAAVYAKHGGMNKRKAGEDFYFLHKLVPHEHFTMVTAATVYPSCRTSDRVPFGTGKAQNDWLEKKDKVYMTYDPAVFKDLKVLNTKVSQFFTEKESTQVIHPLPRSIATFLEIHDYLSKIELIRKNCKDLPQFIKQFYTWFDGFLCLKFVHHARDHFYPNIPLEKAAKELLQLSASPGIEALLVLYRNIDIQSSSAH